VNTDAVADPTRSPIRRRAWRAVAAIGVAAGLVALAACGDDDDNTPAGTTTPPASSAKTATTTEGSMMTHDSSMTSASG
jgi:hypothetical protein